MNRSVRSTLSPACACRTRCFACHRRSTSSCMRMRDEVLRLWQARGTTTLLVTHDIDEAIYMSDRIVIMTPHPGHVERNIDIELPRPRERNSAEFLRLRSDILEHLHF